jgi:hypothetical protein
MDEMSISESSELLALREKENCEKPVRDLKWLASHEQGRRILWRLITDSGALSTSFSLEAIHMAFNEGRRSIGLHLLEMVKSHAPERLVEMLSENTRE